MLSTYTRPLQQVYSFPQIQFSSINMSSLSISQINQVPVKFVFIIELNLDSNLLSSLSGIDQFMNLQILSLNFNFISEKQELLKVRNKFMVRELSILGNYCQKFTNHSWLKGQGFTSLVTFNEVARIGFVAKNKSSYSLNQQSPLNQHSFSKQYQIKPNLTLNSCRPPQIHEQINNQTNQMHNQSIQNSGFIYVTNRGKTSRLTKNKSRFESTGDTRRRKPVSQELHQTSRYENSFESSPNFNNFRENSFRNPAQNYLSSTKRKKISEFMLYPVDEEINRSRTIENQLIEPNRMYQNFSNNYRNRINTQSSKQKHFLNIPKQKVQVFRQTDERADFIKTKDKYNFYRSDFYYLEPTQMTVRMQSQQSDNNVIERHIPVYKQAIAIAFYYRNLLEKVFRGFRQTIDLKDHQIKFNQQHQNDDLTKDFPI